MSLARRVYAMVVDGQIDMDDVQSMYPSVATLVVDLLEKPLETEGY